MCHYCCRAEILDTEDSLGTDPNLEDPWDLDPQLVDSPKLPPVGVELITLTGDLEEDEPAVMLGAILEVQSGFLNSALAPEESYPGVPTVGTPPRLPDGDEKFENPEFKVGEFFSLDGTTEHTLLTTSAHPPTKTKADVEA